MATPARTATERVHVNMHLANILRDDRQDTPT